MFYRGKETCYERTGTSPARSPAKSLLSFIGKNSHGNRVEIGSTLAAAHLIDRAALRFALFENGDQPQSVNMLAGVFAVDLDSSPSHGAAAHSCLRARQARETLFIFYYQSRHRLHFEAQLSNGVASPFEDRLPSRVRDGATSSVQQLC
jgi:hypothetical protein